MGAALRLALTSRRRAALLALLALLCAAPSAHAAPPVAIYGIELDVQEDRERVLVFAHEPLEGRLEPRDAETLRVVIPGAVLDPSAPARVAGARGVRLVAAEEKPGPEGPGVLLLIHHAPGPPAELTRRGATLAIEFAAAGRAVEPGIVLQFANADLAEVVEAVARATGQRFVFDEDLQGRVTITSPAPLSRGEALELLHTVLLMKGYVAVPMPAGGRKILQFESGVAAAPWTLEAPSAESEALTATLVRLRDAAAEQVVTLLQPWVSGRAVVVAFAPTNALILVGGEARLRETLTLVAALDEGSGSELVVRRLQHQPAGQAAEQLLAAMGRRQGARRAVEAWPDERTGALVLRSTPDRLREARAFLDEIDRPAPVRGGLEVIRLRYADPEAMAKLLGALAAGGGGAPAEAPVAAETASALAGRNFSVSVYAPTSSLLVRSDPETLRFLRDLVDELDRAPPTIEVEVLVLQVICDDSLDLGFDAFIPLTTPKSPDDLIASVLLDPTGGGLLQPGTGGGPVYAARFTRAPLVIPFVDGDGNPAELILPRTSAVLTAEDRLANSQILMRPHLRMLAGEEQEIFAGDNIPIPVASTDALGPVLGNPFRVNQNVERQDVGITLRVRPTVGEAGGVQLELEVDTTSLAPPTAGDVEEVGPTIRQRRLTSKIQLSDGEFAVVGFAREPAFERTTTGVPWLSDVPILGWAFKSTVERSLTARFVIAAQARIERSPEERLADSIRRRLAFERSIAGRERAPAGAPTAWALRVATLADAAEAQAVAERVGTSERPASVRRWESSAGPVFDVQVSGFSELSQTGAAALALREAGFDPELIVLPIEGP